MPGLESTRSSRTGGRPQPAASRCSASASSAPARLRTAPTEASAARAKVSVPQRPRRVYLHPKRSAACGILVLDLGSLRGVGRCSGRQVQHGGDDLQRRPPGQLGFCRCDVAVPALGGTVLEGNPTVKIRSIAPARRHAVHGVFEQLGKAKIHIVFPFDEHIQVIDGVLKITDSAGTVSHLSPGDSKFIAQGTVILWETLTPVFQKSVLYLYDRLIRSPEATYRERAALADSSPQPIGCWAPNLSWSGGVASMASVQASTGSRTRAPGRAKTLLAFDLDKVSARRFLQALPCRSSLPA